VLPYHNRRWSSQFIKVLINQEITVHYQSLCNILMKPELMHSHACNIALQRDLISPISRK
jgi:hypothetical protein